MARRRTPAASKSPLTARSQIDLFMHRAGELFSCRVITSGTFKISAKIVADLDNLQAHVSTNEPDFEDIRSLLVVFRKFISSNSHCFLPKIYNLCHQHITDVKMRQALADARADWLDMQKNSPTGMTVTIDSRDYTPAELTDIWMNGYIFHDDPEAVSMLDRMEQYHRDLARIVALDYITWTIKIIHNLRNNIYIAQTRGWLSL
jgi:hypothetical protein